MKVYVIIQDDSGDFHQAHIDESKAIIVSNLVTCYSGNSMTKELINDVIIPLAKVVNFKKVK